MTTQTRPSLHWLSYQASTKFDLLCIHWHFAVSFLYAIIVASTLTAVHGFTTSGIFYVNKLSAKRGLFPRLDLSLVQSISSASTTPIGRVFEELHFERPGLSIEHAITTLIDSCGVNFVSSSLPTTKNNRNQILMLHPSIVARCTRSTSNNWP